MGYLRPTVLSDRMIASHPTVKTLQTNEESKESDNLVQRIVTYIPAESVGAYVAVSNFFQSKEGTVLEGFLTWYWVAFGVILGFTPIYMLIATIDPKLIRKTDPYKWYQVFVSPIAFALWAFALGGPFATFKWYHPAIAGVALILGTIAIGALDKLIDFIYKAKQP